MQYSLKSRDSIVRFQSICNSSLVEMRFYSRLLVIVLASYLVTEEEVYRGILSQPDAKHHALCFERVLVDINYQHEKVSRFVDIHDGKNIILC